MFPGQFGIVKDKMAMIKPMQGDYLGGFDCHYIIAISAFM